MGLNYPPETTGISPYTGGMAKGMVRRGFETDALTAHPHYPAWRIKTGYGEWARHEVNDGVGLTRLRHYVPHKPSGLRRALSEMSFGLRLVSTRWGKPDAIVLVSPALIASWFALTRSRITHRSTPTIIWIQDLYSLGLEETGQGSGIVRRAMRSIERRVLRRATTVVVIHERFAAYVSSNFDVPPGRIRVVRNWTHIGDPLEIDRKAVRGRLGWGESETVVLHAGNMGVKQGLSNVVRAARLADDRQAPVRFVLLGSGSDQARLKAEAKGIDRLTFLDSLPDEQFAAALQAADVLLVNEMPGVANMAAPSKLTSYFSMGRPVLAATDSDGITAEEVHAAQAGVVVPAGSPAALLDGAMEIAADPTSAEQMGISGMRYRRTVLDEETALDKFIEILSTDVDNQAYPKRRNSTA